MCYVVALKDDEDKYICYLHDKEMAETISIDVQLKTGREAVVLPMWVLDAKRLKIPYIEEVWDAINPARAT